MLLINDVDAEKMKRKQGTWIRNIVGDALARLSWRKKINNYQRNACEIDSLLHSNACICRVKKRKNNYLLDICAHML